MTFSENFPGNDGTLQERSSAWASEPEPVIETAEPVVEPPFDTNGEAPDAGHVADAEAAVEAASASGDAVEAERAVEYLEALLGEDKQQLRADLQLPVKINGETKHVSLSEITNGYQRTEDYTRKTMALANERRALEDQRKAIHRESRTAEETRKLLTAEHEKLLAARQDPDKFSAHLEHIDRLANDPEYAETWQRAEKSRLRDVEDSVDQEMEQEAQTAQLVNEITDFAQGLSQLDKYAGKVDVEAALALYDERLRQGTADLHSRHLRKAFDDVLTQRDRVVGPLETELQSIKAEMASLRAAQTADGHNAGVRGKVRASTAPGRRTPPVNRTAATPATGKPASARPAVETLQERSRAWASS